MKKLWLLALAAISFTGIAATTYTITQLTLNTNPSSGTVIEVYDPAATPKSGKYSLTNLTDGKQPASANLTNWSGIAATTAGVQATLGQVYQATNSNLTLLSGYGPATWQATNSNLTTLSTLNGSSLTNIAASNIVSGGSLIVSTVVASKSFQSYQGSLTHAGTVTLDFDGANTCNSLSATGNVTFSISNAATNRNYRLLVKNGQSTNVSVTWPSGVHGQPPSLVAAGKWSLLTLESWGTGDTNVIVSVLPDL